MTLATRAYVEFALAAAKDRIENLIMRAAREGKRTIELASLPCQNEHVKSLIEWMESEGLRVEHKKWMDKPRGLGSMLSEPEDMMEYSQYVITF